MDDPENQLRAAHVRAEAARNLVRVPAWFALAAGSIASTAIAALILWIAHTMCQ